MNNRKKTLKICIISSQISGFGKIGGFGNMTKKLAVCLQQHGVDVSVVVPRRAGQKRTEIVDGVKVIGLKPAEFFSKKLYQDIDADIYHSQNPNFFSFVALLAEPTKKHIVTCRDPRDMHDWLTELSFATWKRRLKTPFVFLFEHGPLISYVVKRADIVGSPAYFLIDKVRTMYHRKDVVLLPNIEDFPEKKLKKNTKPTVCFIGRLDKRKRPEMIFELAKAFPAVRFLVVGKAEDDDRQALLEQEAARCKNIKMLGYVDKFSSNTLKNVLEESWILLNTSIREGLPLTFIEAAGYGCAILSRVNPDEFAHKFGFWAENDDFAAGLQKLLKQNAWKKKGAAGKRYVRSLYNEPQAIDRHLKICKRVLSSG